jgi:hypothetical protein
MQEGKPAELKREFAKQTSKRNVKKMSLVNPPWLDHFVRGWVEDSLRVPRKSVGTLPW